MGTSAIETIPAKERGFRAVKKPARRDKRTLRSPLGNIPGLKADRRFSLNLLDPAHF
jgi:hypothetical protein